MDEVIALVKNAFKDITLANSIGTTVNIIGTKKQHSDTLTKKQRQLGNLALNGGDYNVFSFITAPGAEGWAWEGVVCESSNLEKLNWNAAYGSNQCNWYDPPEPIDCTKTSNRIALTSELIAHEIGHNLGMTHDFIQSVYDDTYEYEYRKYQNEPTDCRGLMDYIDDGVGWSKCSARDFSRYITSGGTKSPCLSGCVDLYDACTSWASLGFCTHSNYFYSLIGWMATNCKTSCGLCQG